MPQSLSAVYFHLVFSTKERRPFLRWEDPVGSGDCGDKRLRDGSAASDQKSGQLGRGNSLRPFDSHTLKGNSELKLDPARRLLDRRKRFEVRRHATAAELRLPECIGRRLSRVRIAEPGHRRVGAAHLRRRQVRIAFADEDQRFPSFFQRPHVDDQRFDCR